MANAAPGYVEVSRTINATPAELFAVLTDPRRHLDFDGSDMLRGTEHDAPITATGDAFLMRMHHPEFGDYVMRNRVLAFEADRHVEWSPLREDVEDDDWDYRWGYRLAPRADGKTDVTEYFDCTRSPDEAKVILKNGEHWRMAMINSLAKLAEIFPDGR